MTCSGLSKRGITTQPGPPLPPLQERFEFSKRIIETGCCTHGLSGVPPLYTCSSNQPFAVEPGIPGTDRDVESYKATDHKATYLPSEGWMTCPNAGVDPPPVLKLQGVSVPSSAEFQTLEHQLVKWAIEIVEQVLGDTNLMQRDTEANNNTMPLSFVEDLKRRDQSRGVCVLATIPKSESSNYTADSKTAAFQATIRWSWLSSFTHVTNLCLASAY